MARNKTYNKRNVLIVFLCVVIAASLLAGRLTYLMIFRSKDYAARAEDYMKGNVPLRLQEV